MFLTKPKATLVCVDYSDILELTLPRNRHHFEDVMIVTTPDDQKTMDLAEKYDCQIYATNRFYDGGAEFNKWVALEAALDRYGRDGVIAIMDADIVLPHAFPDFKIECGNLYTPLRRMIYDVTIEIPEEKDWNKFPYHPQQKEFAGYLQLFHGDDSVLGCPPWHETNWKHAGGADSFFQAQWNQKHKIRPPFEVLHLGPSGENWCGRTTQYTNGTTPEESKERKAALMSYFRQRRRNRGELRFCAEKLPNEE